jgi:hypothetical protein
VARQEKREHSLIQKRRMQVAHVEPSAPCSNTSIPYATLLNFSVKWDLLALQHRADAVLVGGVFVRTREDRTHPVAPATNGPVKGADRTAKSLVRVEMTRMDFLAWKNARK